MLQTYRAARCAFALCLLLTVIAAARPAAALQAGPPPTNTPRLTAIPTSSPRPTKSETPTRPPTVTRTPLPTSVILGTYETPVQAPVAPIPLPLPPPKATGDDVVVVMLLGSDTITSGTASRTDVIILASVNRTAGTVALVHIPRDLYVYVPNYTMVKINTVMNYGNTKYGEGKGAKLLKETILYNLGIKIDFFARVDFVSFQALIAKLGGLDISVDCALEDWKLKAPNLTYGDPESWQKVILNVGRHKMDPYTALWYSRSRMSSSDFERGRRQEDVLRAMWRQGRAAGVFAQVTDLWPEIQKTVETDMNLQDVLGLAPVGVSIDPQNVQRIDLAPGVQFHYQNDLGAYGLLVIPEGMSEAMTNFLLPPSPNRLNGESPKIEIGAGLAYKGLDQVGGDRLSWEGFNVKVLGTEGMVNRTSTTIIDYTGNAKPASLQALIKLLRTSKSQVIQKPDPNATVDFHIEMGRDYASCLHPLPKDTSIPTPGN